MAAKVTGGDAIRRRMRVIRRNVRAAVAQAMDDAADDLLVRAVKLAPQLEDDLIESGDVLQTNRRDTFKRVVLFSRPYAAYQHEGINRSTGAPLKPGPRTRQKPSTADGTPGPKYLERPYMRHRRRYVTDVGDAVKDAIRRSVR